MASLIAACVAFVGSHFLLSHPLRAGLVAKLGERRFLGVYSLVALATFAWILVAAGNFPPEAPLWTCPDWLWSVASLLMLLASILLIGSFFGNPALPAPGAGAALAKQPRGVFAITRHPMMWAFAFWGVVHIMVWPTPSNLVIGAAFILLALGGSVGQDIKKAKLMGPDWQGWTARTAFVPFTGPATVNILWPGWAVVAGGIALWLVATWAHPWFGAPIVGMWRAIS